MPAGQLACLLQDTAAGLCADTAAVALIAAHGHFLHQPDLVTAWLTPCRGR
jgi:hypothetical protein